MRSILALDDERLSNSCYKAHGRKMNVFQPTRISVRRGRSAVPLMPGTIDPLATGSPSPRLLGERHRLRNVEIRSTSMSTSVFIFKRPELRHLSGGGTESTVLNARNPAH